MTGVVASVVISTRNRSRTLAGALDALLEQSFSSYEVIVVDNNSSDDTREVVTRYVREASGRVRYVVETREGVSHGRNRGIASSTGTMIAFTDDDVRVDRHWLATGVQMLEEHTAYSYVGGPVLPIWTHPPPGWLTREHWSPLAAVEYGPEAFDVPRDRAVCLITANLLIRREVLDAVGWFNPVFRRCQDRELMLRLWRAGFAGAYHPNMTARTVVPFERLQRAYHRRWYATHGYFLAQMPLREQLAENGVVIQESTRGRFFFGAPLFEYRALLTHLGGWAGSLVCGRHEEAFAHELRIRYSAAFLQASIAQWLMPRGQTTTALNA